MTADQRTLSSSAALAAAGLIDPARVPEAFFRSYFTPHGCHGKSQRYPDDIGRLWAELHRQPQYPLDDLVPHLTVAEAMRLGE